MTRKIIFRPHKQEEKIILWIFIHCQQQIIICTELLTHQLLHFADYNQETQKYNFVLPMPRLKYLHGGALTHAEKSFFFQNYTLF